jgi:hypothetical protein
MGDPSRWCLIAAVGCGVLAAGLRSVTQDSSNLVAAIVVCGPTTLVYLLITAVMRVPEALLVVGWLRRLPRGAGARQG